MSLFPEISIKTDLSEVYDQISKLQTDLDTKVHSALSIAGQAIITYLQSSGSEFGLADGIRAGDGPRDKHPGGFADRTGNLNRRFNHRVIKTRDGWILRLSNNAEYAVYLDEMEGIFVLSGVADGPDTIGMKEVAKALKKTLPNWKISV